MTGLTSSVTVSLNPAVKAMREQVSEHLAELPLKCEIVDGAIVIRVGADTVKFATENHPEFWDPETDTYRYKVADPAEWLQGVARYINDEREDGSSLLTDLFDRAILEAVEQGEEGLVDED